MAGQTDPGAAATPIVDVVDERLSRQSWYQRLMRRSDSGALAGAVLVLVFFAFTAGDTGMFASDGILSWMTVTAQLMIIGVGAALLMVGGEFDLSVGSMIGFTGMMIAIPTIYFHVPVGLSVILAFVVAMAIGALNGYIIVRTRLPSFIVTLASLYILRGLTIALSIIFTNRTIVSGLKEYSDNSFVASLFSAKLFPGFFQWLADNGIINKLPNGAPAVPGIPMLIVWAFVIAVIGHIVLTRTRIGNWIFASGGDADAARNVGVPVSAVKISLFMVTAFCATVFAACQVFEFGSAAADRGLLKEFEAIIAAVIGGCLLTGGYGSVIGACLGALIFGVVQQGILFTGAPSDWFQVFLGAMLLIAVLFNSSIRRRVTGER
ncbi:MAG: ABC transporter permease [Rhizobiales bacterium]|nr:ABC transporter permease [Hyphomicrobiales bacterium]